MRRDDDVVMTDTAPGAPILEIDDLAVSYAGGAVRALDGVDLTVRQGQIVVLLGVNGAGKTTTLSAVTGLLPFMGGSVDRGSIRFHGDDIGALRPAPRVRRGISMVMEGRHVFPDLSVAENLAAGGFTRTRAEVREGRERVHDLFPILAERASQPAGLLSGGEQQMLAIGRALMQAPDLLLLDEPSLGLAPLVVERITEVIVDINRQGTSVLLIEQNAAMALSIADDAYVLDGKRVARHATGAELLADETVRQLYLGMSDGESRRRRNRARSEAPAEERVPWPRPSWRRAA